MRFNLVIIGAFLFTKIAFAQEEVVFSGSFNNADFKSFITKIEKETRLSVFYNPKDFKKFLVTIEADSTPINQIFERLFRNTQYYYVVDNERNIYLTSDYFIQDQLPENFFATKTNEESAYRLSGITFVANGQDSLVEKKTHFIGRVSKGSNAGNAIVSGIITEIVSGHPVIGATVYCETVEKGVATDASGGYSIMLPKGDYVLKISAVGMVSTTRKVSLHGDGILNVLMQEDVKMLNEVVVESERDVNVRSVQMGIQKLDMKAMKKFAAPMGEVDILRVVLSMPGVQTVGEASTGLNVRGGSASQNLILYNNAVVYNPSHLFGFFTAFNPDEIQSVEVQKGTFPVEQGGRLSSVIDIHSRTGNKEKLVATGGIGLLTGRFTVEGPLKKDKTSILIGGRSSYSNWLLQQVPTPSISNSSASFYDLNMNVSHAVDSKNSLFMSGYFSKDDFKFNDDSLYRYRNRAMSIRWKHDFSDQLSGSFVIANSRYDYSVGSIKNPVEAFELSYKTEQYDIKVDFDLMMAARHNLTFGLNSTFYNVHPGQIKPNSDSSLVVYDQLQREVAVENALFIGDNFEVNSKISVYAGIRYSFFSALGPRTVYQYTPNIPKTEGTIIDTLQIGRFRSSTFYHGPEYRFSFRYSLNTNLSVKLGYNLMRQYLQILSNTTAISPTDVWKLSDQHIKPQLGSQVSVGIFKNLRDGAYELSMEGYYKRMTNILDYKDGADLLLNHTIEADVLNAKGLSFGTEFMIKKSNGKLNGWMSYVYSRSYLQTQSNFVSETVNGGNYYPSNYDKPHAFNLTGNYRVSHRFGLSFNATYSTGRPITLPLAKYELAEALRLLYSERNQYRVPDYFRADVGISVEGNHKIRKLAHSSWTFGIYNLTGRKNIYSVFFKSNGSTVSGYKMSIFGTPIPSITYNFRF